MNMRMSPQGRKMLMELEGFKQTVYYDAAGLPTVGVGHLLTPQEKESGLLIIAGQAINLRNVLTVEQVDTLLEQDLPTYENAVNRLVSVPLTQNQFDTLVSFCFNVGETRFKRSTLLSKVNLQQLGSVPDELKKWRFVTLPNGQKKEVKGLVKRREIESKHWTIDFKDNVAQTNPIDTFIQSKPLDNWSQADYAAKNSIMPKEYVPDRWLSLVNPLDWFPKWGTYLSIAAALILFLVDSFSYPMPQWAYAILGAFAAARMRRAIDRPTNQTYQTYQTYGDYYL